MKNKIFVYLLFFYPLILLSQNILENDLIIKKAKISLKNYNLLTVQDLSITKDSLSFFEPIRKEVTSIHLSEVNSVWLKKGNYSGRGALIGTGFMLLVSLQAISEVNQNPDLELDKNADKSIALYVFGGTIFGGIIGSFFPKWKPLDLKKNNTTLSFKPNSFYIDKNSFTIGVNIQIE